MKQAKIQLTADTRGFKKQIDDAKGMLKTMGDGNISTASADKLKKIYGTQLGASLKQINKDIKNTQKTLETMANASSKSFDGAKIVIYTNKLDGLLKKAKEIKNVQDQIAGGKMPEVPDAGGSGGSKMFGGAGRMLTGLAGGMGVMASMSRRNSMADGRLRVRGLSTDGTSVGEKSALGYTPEERRTRAAEIAGQTAASGAELTDMTSSGEQMERAYGISGESFAGSIGAARKAGIGDQGKFVKNVVGSGRGAGLEGPQVGEYLQSITGYLGEMSKGVNIDGDSLNGFASAMATLPFFKKDSARTMETLKGMEAGFKGSDEFQKAQSFRVLDALAPGASASAIDMRKEMGIFGGLNKNDKDDQKTIQGLKNQGMNDKDIKMLTLSGADIINETFKQVLKDTEGRSTADQAREFGKRTNIDERAALEIYSQRKDGKIGLDGMAEKVKEAQKDMPIEKRLKETYSGGDAAAKSVNALKEQTLDGIAEKIADPINKLTMKLDELIQALGGDTSSIASTVGAVGVAGAAGVGAYGAIKTGKKVLGEGIKKAAPKLTSAVSKAGKFGAKAAPWLGKAAPFASKALGIAGAMWPEDSGAAEGSIDDRMEKGTLTPEDYAQMSASQASGKTPGGMPSATTTSHTPASVSAMSGGQAGMESDVALSDNTQALREMTQSLRSPRQITRNPIPESAKVINQGRHR